jgi:hypothetical protein
MSSRGKSVSFTTDEELDELVTQEYGKKRTFTPLSALFPGFYFSHHLKANFNFKRRRCKSIQGKDGFNKTLKMFRLPPRANQ